MKDYLLLKQYYTVPILPSVATTVVALYIQKLKLISAHLRMY